MCDQLADYKYSHISFHVSLSLFTNLKEGEGTEYGGGKNDPKKSWKEGEKVR